METDSIDDEVPKQYIYGTKKSLGNNRSDYMSGEDSPEDFLQNNP